MRAGLAHSVDFRPWRDTNIVAGDDTGYDGAVQVAVAVRLRFLRRDKVRATAEVPQLIVGSHAGIDNGNLYALPGGKGVQTGAVVELILARLGRKR